VETDELAIYGWINPVKPPEEVKVERYRMVVILAVRYGVHQYLDDVWQEWQLAVYQRTRVSALIPVEQREAFSFGIARNLCRTYQRTETRTVPILNPARPEGSSGGVSEQEVEQIVLEGGRAGRPSEPRHRCPEPEFVRDVFESYEGLHECLKKLRPELRLLLQLTYWKGRLSQEVAQLSGLSPDNVRQRVHRARIAIRRCLEARQNRSVGEEGKHAGIN
jgi:RNA polymerase sigma factor (sigma-70 family)